MKRRRRSGCSGRLSRLGRCGRGGGNDDGDAIAGLDEQVGAYLPALDAHVALLDQPLYLRSRVAGQDGGEIPVEPFAGLVRRHFHRGLAHWYDYEARRTARAPTGSGSDVRRER